MSPAAPKNLPVWLGVSEQVRRRTVLEYRVAVTELPRLREALAGDAGELECRLAFARDADRLDRVSGAIGGTVELECQRCLKPYAAELTIDVNWCIAGSEAEEDRLQREHDVVLADEDRLALREVFQDEVLLALPIVPRCDREACTGTAAALD